MLQYTVVDMVFVKFEKHDCVMGMTGAFTFSVSQELPSAAGSISSLSISFTQGNFAPCLIS